jgi:polyisoprenoid-binding protein YceI
MERPTLSAFSGIARKRMNRMRLRATFGLTALLAGLFVSLSAAPARADKFKVDPAHSSLVFRIKHMDIGYIHGRFNEFGGTFAFEEKGGALAIEIKAASIDTNNKMRDTHLKSADFLNVKEFPKINFKSTAVKTANGKVYDVTGDLTLHGVTKSATARLERIGTTKHPRTGQIVTGFETTFTIKRSDFGMKFLVGAIGDEVRITLAVEGVRQP